MLSSLLVQRAAQKNPIRVGIIGAGKFGSGLVAQISQMQGMEVSAIADINPEHAIGSYASSGITTEEVDYRSTKDRTASLKRSLSSPD